MEFDIWNDADSHREANAVLHVIAALLVLAGIIVGALSTWAAGSILYGAAIATALNAVALAAALRWLP